MHSIVSILMEITWLHMFYFKQYHIFVYLFISHHVCNLLWQIIMQIRKQADM